VPNSKDEDIDGDGKANHGKNHGTPDPPTMLSSKILSHRG